MHQTFARRRLKEQQRWTRGRRKAARTKVIAQHCGQKGRSSWRMSLLPLTFVHCVMKMAIENQICGLALARPSWSRDSACNRDPHWEVRCSALVSCFFLRLHSVILASVLLIRSDSLWSPRGRKKPTVSSSGACVCVRWGCVTMPTLKGLNERTWLRLINIERWRQGLTSDGTRTRLIVSLVWLFCFCAVRWPTLLMPWSWSSCLRRCSRAAWLWWPPPTEPLTVRWVFDVYYVCKTWCILLRWINVCLCSKCTTETHCFGKPAISDAPKGGRAVICFINNVKLKSVKKKVPRITN